MIVLNICNTIQYATPLGFINATTFVFAIQGVCTIASNNEVDGNLHPPPTSKSYSWHLHVIRGLENVAGLRHLGTTLANKRAACRN